MGRFRARQRLRTRSAFDRVFRVGARADGRFFVLVAAPNGQPHDRLGLTVSRRVGGAVARNRVKRRLREAFRRLPPRATAVDLVVLAKVECAAAGQREIEHELGQRLGRLERSRRLVGSSADRAR